jgi:hypothetical protein
MKQCPRCKSTLRQLYLLGAQGVTGRSYCPTCSYLEGGHQTITLLEFDDTSAPDQLLVSSIDQIVGQLLLYRGHIITAEYLRRNILDNLPELGNDVFEKQDSQLRAISADLFSQLHTAWGMFVQMLLWDNTDSNDDDDDYGNDDDDGSDDDDGDDDDDDDDDDDGDYSSLDMSTFWGPDWADRPAKNAEDSEGATNPPSEDIFEAQNVEHKDNDHK